VSTRRKKASWHRTAIKVPIPVLGGLPKRAFALRPSFLLAGI
jgi:hypothetical protein